MTGMNRPTDAGATRTRHTGRIALGVLLTVVIAGVIIYAGCCTRLFQSILPWSDTAKPGHIVNASTPASTPKHVTRPHTPAKTPQHGTPSPVQHPGIASRIGAIEDAINQLVTDGWGYPSVGQHEQQLQKLGVMIDWDSMKQPDGRHVFKYADENGEAYAGWLQSPVTCRHDQNAASYTCEGKGDYGFMEMNRYETAADLADKIHDVIKHDAYGPGGSERSVRPFRFKLQLDSSGQHATLSLMDKDMFTE